MPGYCKNFCSIKLASFQIQFYETQNTSNSNDPGQTKTPSNLKRLSLPQIDVLKGRDDFALSSIGSLKKDWFVTTVNQTIGGSKIVVRKRKFDTVCEELDDKKEAIRMRRRRAWIRGIWQKAIWKVIKAGMLGIIIICGIDDQKTEHSDVESKDM